MRIGNEAGMVRLGDAIEERAELLTQMRSLIDSIEAERRDMSADERARYDTREARVREIDQAIEERDERNGDGYVELHDGRRLRLGGDRGPLDGGERIGAQRRTRQPVGADQREALSVIERRSRDLDVAAADRLAALVERDRSGRDSRYLRAVADPAYYSAFAKRLARPDTAHQEFTADEAEAVARVADVMSERRAMSVGSDSGGGYAVPFELDPTILLTSDGAINPLRQLANVITLDYADEWRGVTSEGVEASFVPEATEASDDSPTLAQPVIRPERAQAFVPYSIELAQDWEGLAIELARLFADAKDNLEAEKFLSGTGSDEPEGLLAGLDAASVIPTATAGAYAADDVYALQEAVPARFQPRASWLSSLTIANETHRFSSPGGDEPPLFNENRDRLLGKPWSEISQMSTDSATADEQILAYGDINAGYKIVDRIGLTVEVVQHLFGANQRPTGQRGLYAYWRVGAGVVIDNAIRALEVGAP